MTEWRCRMQQEKDESSLWVRLYWICLALYTVYGISSSAISDVPIQGMEGTITYNRIGEIWAKGAWSQILRMPWWVIGTGIIPLFLSSILFLAVFGANLFALQLTSFFWNLGGLWLLSRTIDEPRELFFSTAVLAFGVPVMTEMHLGVSGAYTEIILPVVTVLYFQRWFLENAAGLSARRAAALSGGLAILTGFMPLMFPGVLAICIVTVSALSADDRRRLWWPLVGGGAAGAAIMVPVLLAQIYPGHAVYLTMDGTLERLRQITLVGLPDFLKIRGLRYSGYPLAVAFFFLAFHGLRKMNIRGEPRWNGLLIASLVIFFWLPTNTHIELDAPEPDLFRFRQLALAWPFWALFLASGVERVDHIFAHRLWRRAYQGLLLGTVAAGIVALYGALNWKAWGVTRHIQLRSFAARVVDEGLPHFHAPGHAEYMKAVPEEFRPTLAMLSSLGGIITAHLGNIETLPQTAAEIGSEYAEEFWTGFGLIACEGSMRNAPLAEKKISWLKQKLTSQEGAWIDCGCRLGMRWKTGEIYFAELGWPLEPRVIETGAARLWGDFRRYRSRE